MRNIKITFLFILFTGIVSCSKFLDVNDNPNVPTEVPPNVLLPTTSVGIGWLTGGLTSMCTSIWMQYTAGLSGVPRAYDIYDVSNQSFNLDWNGSIYLNIVNNLKDMIAKNEEDNPAYSGIAKIQLAYVMSIATDLWGDVPYSEAGMGEAITLPRFDSQQDIYLGNESLGIVSLFDLVYSGIEDLDKPSGVNPAKDDIIYNGNKAKWKKAGNSLILKLANTISFKEPTIAKTHIQNVLNSPDGFIAANADNLQVPFLNLVENQNPIYAIDRTGIYKDAQMLTTSFRNLMYGLNDTIRLGKYFTKPNGVFTTVDNGEQGTPPALASRSVYNDYVVGANGEAPIRLLTNCQSQFILAEAVLNLSISGDANAYYQAGIRASMTQAGMTTAEVTNYFNTNSGVVNLAGSNEDKLEQIITQKYISLIGNSFDAYNNYRRTGYPKLMTVINAAGDNNGNMPLRIPYTTIETNANTNLPSPLPTGANKVWWNDF